MRPVSAATAVGAALLATALPSSATSQTLRGNWTNPTHQKMLAEAAPNPFPGAILPKGSLQEEANALIVLQFYDHMMNKKDFDAASKLIGSRYNQHELKFPNDRDGLGSYIKDLQTRTPKAGVDVKRVVMDGEYVFLHGHFKKDAEDLGSIAGEIFRLEQGKIVERWSVMHVIPETPHPENPNGVFGGGNDGSRRK